MKNQVTCEIYVEEGYSIEDSEYELFILKHKYPLNIHPTDTKNGVDDITLIRDAISNYIASLPKETGCSFILDLKETREWKDVFWHKYYTVVNTEILSQ